MKILRTLTNAELLRHLATRKGASPVIDELVRRLEEATVDSSSATCPICETELYCEADKTTGQYVLEHRGS